MGRGSKNDIGIITIISDITKEKKTTTTYGRMWIYLNDYIFLRNYGMHVLLLSYTSVRCYLFFIIFSYCWRSRFFPPGRAYSHRCCPKYRWAVFCYPIWWAFTDLIFKEIKTGVRFKLVNLFEFLLVKQLSASVSHYGRRKFEQIIVKFSW